MKRNIRIFAVLLVICMFMTSINVYALDTNKDVVEERIFTKAELACMTDGSFGTATGLSDEFIEVKNIEGNKACNRNLADGWYAMESRSNNEWCL